MGKPKRDALLERLRNRQGPATPDAPIGEGVMGYLLRLDGRRTRGQARRARTLMLQALLDLHIQTRGLQAEFEELPEGGAQVWEAWQRATWQLSVRQLQRLNPEAFQVVAWEDHPARPSVLANLNQDLFELRLRQSPDEGEELLAGLEPLPEVRQAPPEPPRRTFHMVGDGQLLRRRYPPSVSTMLLALNQSSKLRPLTQYELELQGRLLARRLAELANKGS